MGGAAEFGARARFLRKTRYWLQPFSAPVCPPKLSGI